MAGAFINFSDCLVLFIYLLFLFYFFFHIKVFSQGVFSYYRLTCLEASLVFYNIYFANILTGICICKLCRPRSINKQFDNDLQYFVEGKEELAGLVL